MWALAPPATPLIYQYLPCSFSSVEKDLKNNFTEAQTSTKRLFCFHMAYHCFETKSYGRGKNFRHQFSLVSLQTNERNLPSIPEILSAE
jgi:hypothetical protein